LTHQKQSSYWILFLYTYKLIFI